MDTKDKAPAATTGHIEANGVNYYYEVRGTGEPLLLLHGGLGTIDMFQPMMPAIAEGRQTIAIDLHGHGRSSLGNRPIRPADIADDIAAILKQLGFGAVDVLGYSFGGNIAVRLGIQHPDTVRRAVVVSAGFAREGFYPEMLPQQAQVNAAAAEFLKGTPMWDAYMAVAPNPEDFPRLLDAMGELMRQPFDWSEEVKTLKMPIMLVFADSDMFRPEHEIEFYQLLGGGKRDAGWQREHMGQNRLAILPDHTHYDIFFAPELASTVKPFLDGKSGARSWSDTIREGQ